MDQTTPNGELKKNYNIKKIAKQVRTQFWRVLALLSSPLVLKQEAQLMLKNPHDRMFYVNRVSAYLVPFSR